MALRWLSLLAASSAAERSLASEMSSRGLEEGGGRGVAGSGEELRRVASSFARLAVPMRCTLHTGCFLGQAHLAAFIALTVPLSNPCTAHLTGVIR